MSYLFFKSSFHAKSAIADASQPTDQEKHALLEALLREYISLIHNNPFSVDWKSQFEFQAGNVKMSVYTLTGPDGGDVQLFLRNVTITVHRRPAKNNGKVQEYARIIKISPLDIISLQILSAHLYASMAQKESSKKNEMLLNSHLNIIGDRFYVDCSIENPEAEKSWLPYLSIIELEGDEKVPVRWPAEKIANLLMTGQEILGSAILKISKVRDVGIHRLVKIGLTCICATAVRTPQEGTMEALVKQVQHQMVVAGPKA